MLKDFLLYMKLFINNKRIKLIHTSKSLKKSKFDAFLYANHIDANQKYTGKILIYKCLDTQIVAFLKLLETPAFELVSSVSFISDDIYCTEKAIKADFKVIEAAGGLVLNNNKILMIFRLNTWDLPKGKLEKDETTAMAAVREVQEECGVIAENISKICSTWHSYTHKDKRILKKTTWYELHCLDDTNLKPQLEEGITDIKWMDIENASLALSNSYKSVRYVLKKYKKKYLKIYK